MSKRKREDATHSWQESSGHESDAGEDGFEVHLAVPQQIGRYQVHGLLGQGGFGQVFKAYDEQLERFVAIKVPHPRFMSDAESYLNEARALAALDHPNIVPVHDVGQSPEFPCFVVSKFIEGENLAEHHAAGRWSASRSALLVATVAEALHSAHKQGLVHRDVKPGNILIDSRGEPVVVDFGLALRDNLEDAALRRAGTPAYMSPEQARGEGHRVDGRSDIFSLGVVLYELLVGKRPYRGQSPDELLENIVSGEPRPLRQIDDTIPKELERICMRALAPRSSDRYTTARDFAEELREAAATVAESASFAARTSSDSSYRPDDAPSTRMPPSTIEASSVPSQVIPKGLRAYDAHDAEFFLDLLPGPRDREGLPESIRFWKVRIESRDPGSAFPVGLLCGPSGCGKSSLVQAGLLPCLEESIVTVKVEATGDATESQLLATLRRAVPDIPQDVDLPDTLAAIRRGRGLAPRQKLLVVIDQFEQWLHGRPVSGTEPLIRALRQCDGPRLQCLLLVRDDFWMPAVRVMKELEIPLIEGQNSAVVDLFDARHARKVLTRFGRAHGALPSRRLNRDQEELVRLAVEELSEAGKVMCVRLALFSEMLKGRTWDVATLKRVGGAAGVGVAFLEETFSAASAPPQHRFHQRAARAVLAALLPEAGTDIKGHRRSYEELLECSGYKRQPEDFGDLMRLLDSEIRLVTPAIGTPAPAETDREDATGSDARYYQLTHDYLVPPLREWLTRKQKETARGRALLCLEDWEALAKGRPEHHVGPPFRDWIRIRALTETDAWSPMGRLLMAQASRKYLYRTGWIAMLLAVLAIALLLFNGKRVRDARSARAAELIRQLEVADVQQVPGIIEDMSRVRAESLRMLRSPQDGVERDARERLNVSLAVAGLADDAGDELSVIVESLAAATPEAGAIITDALAPHAARATERLWSKVREVDPEVSRLPLAAALASLDTRDERWAELAPSVAHDLLAAPAAELPVWMEALEPVRESLYPPLLAAHRDFRENRDEERHLATEILVHFHRDQPDYLLELLLDADGRQFNILYPAIYRHLDAVEDRLVESLAPLPSRHDEALAATFEEPAIALIEQIEEAGGQVDQRTAWCTALPLAEFAEIQEDLEQCGYRLARLRPYSTGNGTRAAVVWTRDGEPARYDVELNSEQLQERLLQERENGRIPVDIAAYRADGSLTEPTSITDPGWSRSLTDSSGSTLLLFSIVWKTADASSEAAVLLGETMAKTIELDAQWRAEGYRVKSLQMIETPEGERYTGVWHRPNAPIHPELSDIVWFGEEMLDLVPHDVFLRALPFGEARFRARLQRSRDASAVYPQRLRQNYVRAMQWNHLGSHDRALEEIDRVFAADDLRWALWNAAPEGGGVAAFDTRHATDGQCSLRIDLPEENYVLVRQYAAVEPNRYYLLSGWIRTEQARMVAEGGHACAHLSVGNSLWDDTLYHYSVSIEGDRDWTYVAMVFNSRGHVEVDARVGLGSRESDSLGTAWFDGVRLVSLDDDEASDRQVYEPGFAGDRPNLLQNGSFEPDPIGPYAARARALLHLNRLEDAELDLQVVRKDIGQGSEAAIVEALAAGAANPTGFSERLAELLDRQGHVQDVWLAARAWTEWSRWLRDDPEAADAAAARAVDLLEAATADSGRWGWKLRADPWLAFLHGHPRFERLCDEHAYDPMVGVAASNLEERVVSRLVLGVTAEELLEQGVAWREDGYLPFSLSVTTENAPRFSAVFHATEPSYAEREQHDRRRANAAVALLMAGRRSAAVIPLLRQTDDPGPRAFLIERLQSARMDPRALLELSAGASDTAIRQALILGIQPLDEDGRGALSPDVEERLLEWFVEDGDGGVHAAVDWVLRTASGRASVDGWNADGLLRDRLESATVSGTANGWSVNSRGDTMIEVRGPVEFVMGSPPHENPNRRSERARRCRIPYSFAIANKEVTMHQFQEFLADHPEIDSDQPLHFGSEADSPRLAVTWFVAAAYCRWLSEREGVPESEMCYPPVEQLGNGLILPPDFLLRTGYRLPTEAEWEYACRAGARTARFYGESDALLQRFAGYSRNVPASTFPVGRQMPNPLGLFDMYGNAWEWCHDLFRQPRYSMRSHAQLMQVNPARVNNVKLRSLRGGAFEHFASSLRSAGRFGDVPRNEFHAYGFRVARRLPPLD